MKKNNNKGFLLTELLVTATLVCTVLIFLYTQFYNIKRSYDSSFKYNTVTGLYEADNIRNFLIDNGDIANIKLMIKNESYVKLDNSIITINNSYYSKLLEKSNIKNVYFTKENVSEMKNFLNNKKDGSLETLRKFVNNIDYSENESDIYRIIVEFKDDTFATLLLGGE